MYVSDFRQRFPDYPLWITEWQYTGITAAQTTTRERYALQWLDARSYEERYAMFGPMNAANMNGIPNGAMVTDVGKIYAGFL